MIKYLGQEVADKANICYREDKEKFCTGSQDILVDDYEINIEEWTKKGGTGVLFKDAESAEKQLNDILSKMIVSWLGCFNSYILFDYQNRNALTYDAAFYEVTL